MELATANATEIYASFDAKNNNMLKLVERYYAETSLVQNIGMKLWMKMNNFVKSSSECTVIAMYQKPMIPHLKF